MRAILFASLSFVACSSSSPSRTLVLLHTNDEHSHILGHSPEVDDFPAAKTAGSGAIKGGLARRSAILKAERDKAAAAGAASLTVSAGDVMMGTLVQVATTVAAPDFRLMKVMGYDVMALGNHEFDYGPGSLATAIKVAMAAEGMIPTVATNLHFSATDAADDSLEALFDETGKDAGKPVHRSLVVAASNGLRVGFVGIVGADAALKAPTKSPVTFSLASCCGETNSAATMSQLFSDLQPVVDKLRREEKVDLVVALSHSGVNLKDFEAGEDIQIARNVSGIDVIVSGHSHDLFPATLVTNERTGRQVLVQQAGRYGEALGRIQLTVSGEGKVSFDMAQAAIIPVDDTTVAADVRVDLFLAGLIGSLEGTPAIPINPLDPSSKRLSFLEYTLSEAEGRPLATDPIKDDPAVPGDLYFRTLGKTGFKVQGTRVFKEGQGQIMAADAELWAADQIYPGGNLAAVFAAGAFRGDFEKGKSGNISFADIFRVVPLGGSPISGTPGYPLCRFMILTAELKGALDLLITLSSQSESNSDFFLVTAGIKYEYDMSRPVFSLSGDPFDPNNGRVTRIVKTANHDNGVYETYDEANPIYDVNRKAGSTPDPFGGGAAAALKPVVVVSNLYVAVLSYLGGVKLRDPATGKLFANPYQSIIHRPDGSELKDFEVLGGYIKKQSELNGGTLPARYDATVSTQSRRAICAGSKCP